MSKNFKMITEDIPKEKEIFSYEELYKAYIDCKRHKSKTINAIEFYKNEEENLLKLYVDLNNGSYKIGKSIAFVIEYPKVREVFAADFRDRIVHHLIMQNIMKYFESSFVRETYSCRKGKGTLYGIKELERDIKIMTNNYQDDAWILKMDIKSFFMSIEKQRLCDMITEMLQKKMVPLGVKEKRIIELCQMIIMHRPELNCIVKGEEEIWEKLPKNKSLFYVGEGKGLPIGNLTSQVFANYYLDKFDHFVKNNFKGICLYGRYVDDVFFVFKEKERLLESIPILKEYIKKVLHLDFHDDKIYIQNYKKGIKFVGGVVKQGRTYISNRTKENFLRMVRGYVNKKVTTYNINEFIQRFNSYLGFLKHTAGYNIKKMAFGFQEIDHFRPYIEIDKHYKVVKKNKWAFRNLEEKEEIEAKLHINDLWRLIYDMFVVRRAEVIDFGRYLLVKSGFDKFNHEGAIMLNKYNHEGTRYILYSINNF